MNLTENQQQKITVNELMENEKTIHGIILDEDHEFCENDVRKISAYMISNNDMCHV